MVKYLRSEIVLDSALFYLIAWSALVEKSLRRCRICFKGNSCYTLNFTQPFQQCTFVSTNSLNCDCVFRLLINAKSFSLIIDQDSEPPQPGTVRIQGMTMDLTGFLWSWNGIALVLTCLLAIWLFIGRWMTKPMRYPPGPAVWPILGSLPTLVRYNHSFLNTLNTSKK